MYIQDMAFCTSEKGIPPLPLIRQRRDFCIAGFVQITVCCVWKNAYWGKSGIAQP